MFGEVVDNNSLLKREILSFTQYMVIGAQSEFYHNNNTKVAPIVLFYPPIIPIIPILPPTTNSSTYNFFFVNLTPPHKPRL